MQIQSIGLTKPRAKKSYFCEWCGEMISIGEKHRKWVGTCDGDFTSWRMHEECFKALEREVDKAGFLWDGEFEPQEHKRGMTHSEMESEEKNEA